MSAAYVSQMVAAQRTAETVARAELSRRARLARCCRPSALAATARSVRRQLAARRPVACCA